MIRGATLSTDNCYRYRLWRRWRDGPSVLFVMLNPSTADALVDDHTIRKCVGFANRWGAGGIDVVNLYAWRATRKLELSEVQGPVGEFPWADGKPGPVNRNDAEILAVAACADRIVAAWGAWPGPIEWRPARVLDDLLRPFGRIEALALNKDGSPCHPLRLPYDLTPVPL